MGLQLFLHRFINSVEQKNGEDVAKLLSFNDSHVASLFQDLKSQFLQKAPSQGASSTTDPLLKSLDSYISHHYTGIYSDIISCHLCVVISFLIRKNSDDGYAYQSLCLQRFLQSFMAESGTNWALPLLKTLSFDLRTIATRADQQATMKGGKSDKLEDAARLLNKCFTTTMTDRSPLEHSKKWGALNIVNQLFKIYFKLNNLRLCRNLIRAVGQTTFPELSSFPKSQTVTYHYYLGRLHMFNAEYESADEHLSYALQHCHQSATRNKYLTLLYLIPVKLLRGQLPSEKLIEKYRLYPFKEIVKAVKNGNLKLFSYALNTHQKFFVSHGIYLILEKLKTIAYRSFIKRIYHIKDSNKLPLRDFLVGFRLMGVDVDTDEIECIVANLIYLNYIKGYLHHQHGFLVVGNNIPFPPLSSLL